MPADSCHIACAEAPGETQRARRMSGRLRQFFLPKIDRRYLLRLVTVAAVTCAILMFVLTPIRIKGCSMAPTYRDGQLNICFRLRYLFSDPRPGDLVLVSFVRGRAMYLKRVVAVGGDTVAFQNGTLLINGQETDEPYVADLCDWNLPSRRIEPGHIYVVGDNRSMPIGSQSFGSANIKRVKGAPLW